MEQGMIVATATEDRCWNFVSSNASRSSDAGAAGPEGPAVPEGGASAEGGGAPEGGVVPLPVLLLRARPLPGAPGRGAAADHAHLHLLAIHQWGGGVFHCVDVSLLTLYSYCELSSLVVYVCVIMMIIIIIIIII